MNTPVPEQLYRIEGPPRESLPDGNLSASLGHEPYGHIKLVPVPSPSSGPPMLRVGYADDGSEGEEGQLITVNCDHFKPAWSSHSFELHGQGEPRRLKMEQLYSIRAEGGTPSSGLRDERAEFEAFACRVFGISVLVGRDPDGEYANTLIKNMWYAWQARADSPALTQFKTDLAAKLEKMAPGELQALFERAGAEFEQPSPAPASLAEALVECSRLAYETNSWLNGHYQDCARRELSKIVKIVKEALRARTGQDGWIKLSEREPTNADADWHKMVFVYSDKTKQPVGLMSITGGLRDDNVHKCTHWMPKQNWPAPPAAETGGGESLR